MVITNILDTASTERVMLGCPNLYHPVSDKAVHVADRTIGVGSQQIGPHILDVKCINQHLTQNSLPQLTYVDEKQSKCQQMRHEQLTLYEAGKRSSASTYSINDKLYNTKCRSNFVCKCDNHAQNSDRNKHSEKHVSLTTGEVSTECNAEKSINFNKLVTVKRSSRRLVRRFCNYIFHKVITGDSQHQYNSLGSLHTNRFVNRKRSKSSRPLTPKHIHTSAELHSDQTGFPIINNQFETISSRRDSDFTYTDSRVNKSTDELDSIYANFNNCEYNNGMTLYCNRPNDVETAAQEFIRQLSAELNNSDGTMSNPQTIGDLLSEITVVLPCARFATEFVKVEGHVLLFRITEQFDALFTSVTITQWESSLIWTNLTACLCHLSKYAICANEVVQNNAYMNKSTEEDSISDEQLSSLSYDITQRTSENELFSWEIASDKFITMIIDKLKIEKNLTCLEYELELLVKIALDNSTKCSEIIENIQPTVLFDQLKNVYWDWKNHTTSCPTHTAESNETFYSTSRQHLSLAKYDLKRYGLQTLLLTLLYIVLHWSKVNNKFTEYLTVYLNSAQWKKIVEVVPEISSVHTWGVRFNDLSKEFSLPCMSSDQSDWASVNGNSSAYTLKPIQPNDISRELSTKLQKEELKKLTIFIRLIRVICCLHQFKYYYWGIMANRPLLLPLDKFDNEIPQLHSGCFRDENSIQSSTMTLVKPDLWIPGASLDKFQEFPGALGFHCIRAYKTLNPKLYMDMLHYGAINLRRESATQQEIRSDCNFASDLNLRNKSPIKQCNSLRRNVSSVDRRDNNETQFSVLYNRRRHTLQEDTNTISSVNSTTNHIHPNSKFPLFESITAIIQMLCELLSVYDEPPQPKHIFNEEQVPVLRAYLDPILLSSYNTSEITFEDLFSCTFTLFYYSWTEINATRKDLRKVLVVLRSQLIKSLKQMPLTFADFERLLSRCNTINISNNFNHKRASKLENIDCNHPVLVQLREDLKEKHLCHLRQNRMNNLTTFAPLEYIPSKGIKALYRDNQLLYVYLSTDRNSLVIKDTNNHKVETWPLKRIRQILTGFGEKVKKNPDRTLILQLERRDSLEGEETNDNANNGGLTGFTSQFTTLSSNTMTKTRVDRVVLLAKTVDDYNYWLDGFYLLKKINQPSEQLSQDLNKLVYLEMRIRMAGLDFDELPTSQLILPSEAPKIDFN